MLNDIHTHMEQYDDMLNDIHTLVKNSGSLQSKVKDSILAGIIGWVIGIILGLFANKFIAP